MTRGEGILAIANGGGINAAIEGEIIFGLTLNTILS